MLDIAPILRIGHLNHKTNEMAKHLWGIVGSQICIVIDCRIFDQGLP